jgi:hypothetical protein
MKGCLSWSPRGGGAESAVLKLALRLLDIGRDLCTPPAGQTVSEDLYQGLLFFRSQAICRLYDHVKAERFGRVP